MSPVEVPESLRETTLRLFLGRIRQERVLNGNQAQMSDDLRRFLWALAHPEDADADDGSANGTPGRDPGSLLLTTQDLAERWGCSTRYARRKAAEVGGRKVGGRWLVDESDARRSA